jgi:hypothetical protein
MEKKLSKIFWGEKWEKVKMMFLLFLPKETKHGTF